MANPEHLTILNQGVEEWNRWREENPMVQPNLRSAKLVGKNLQDVILDYADLSGANLTGVYMPGASLRKAILVESRLELTLVQDSV